jgi:phosphatidylserine decarboxylase
VAVGATLVGKVHVDFDDLSTSGNHALTERTYADGGHRYPKGRDWGRFEFGSTLVLIAGPGLLRLDEREPGTVLRLGSRIGVLHSPGE